jgi:hypothetical protein
MKEDWACAFGPQVGLDKPDLDAMDRMLAREGYLPHATAAVLIGWARAYLAQDREGDSGATLEPRAGSPWVDDRAEADPNPSRRAKPPILDQVAEFLEESGRSEAAKELREEFERLQTGLEELLDVAERIRGGDSKLDPERWYAARDFARSLIRTAVLRRREL